MVVIVNNNCSLYEKIVTSIQEVKARKAKVIAISNSNDSTISTLADEIIAVPSVPDYIQPIINCIPLQLLAYHTAKLKGCNIDQPKNLAKSVTVE